jgi:hypothetical protein
MKRTLALGVAASLLVAFVVACYEFTGPTPAPYLLLTGTWASNDAFPMGPSVQLDLHSAGGRITGTGFVRYFASSPESSPDAFAISGEYSETPGPFTLAIRYQDGTTATFAAEVHDADSLAGTWTYSAPGSSFHTTFYRGTVPPCSDWAPLVGTYKPLVGVPEPPAFRISVRLQDSLDAAKEAARLAALYGFTTASVYEAPIKGFAADLSRATMAVLRCEPTVMSLSYDAVATGAP